MNPGDPTLMILPLPCFLIALIASCVSTIWPIRLVLKAVRISSDVTVSAGLTIILAALLIRTSIFPNSLKGKSLPGPWQLLRPTGLLE